MYKSRIREAADSACLFTEKFCGKEVCYDQCFCRAESSDDMYVCLSCLKHFPEDIFGDALPPYDQGDGQYGYHQQQTVKAVQDEIFKLL